MQGMVSQVAEREDHILVEDVRGQSTPGSDPGCDTGGFQIPKPCVYSNTSLGEFFPWNLCKKKKKQNCTETFLPLWGQKILQAQGKLNEVRGQSIPRKDLGFRWEELRCGTRDRYTSLGGFPCFY